MQPLWVKMVVYIVIVALVATTLITGTALFF
ncbi:stressosome-associated protein Prli42 [Paludifilum halophilum]|nr:stressosome-associated protein Prli42 [Paludifilum halophilum]